MNGIRTSWVPTENNFTNYYGYDTFSDTGVLLAYGTIIAPRVETQNTLQYMTYNAYPPVQVNGGTLKSHVGFMHQNSTICVDGATAFKSMQNSADGEYYAFYAAGNAPSRFQGDVRAFRYTTQTAASGNVEINLGGNTMYVKSGPVDNQNIYTYNGSNQFIVGDTLCPISTSRKGIAIVDDTAPELSFANTATDAGAAGLYRFNSTFYINSRQSGEDIRLATNNTVRLTIEDSDIAAFDGYVPSNPQSLVTKQFLTVSNLDDVEFPVGPSPVSADQILRYSTINNKWVNSDAGSAVLGNAPLGGWPAGSVGEAIANAGDTATLPISSQDDNHGVDYASGGAIPVTRIWNKDYNSVQEGSFLVDCNGRTYAASVRNDSNATARNAAHATYAKVDSGTTRTGFSLRATYWGDPSVNDPDNGVYQTISNIYGFYSAPLGRDAAILNSMDFVAQGCQSLNNNSVQNTIGFFVPWLC